MGTKKFWRDSIRCSSNYPARELLSRDIREKEKDYNGVEKETYKSRPSSRVQEELNKMEETAYVYKDGDSTYYFRMFREGWQMI